MKTTQEYLQLLKEYKQKRGLLYGISRICLFGSVARGEQTESSDVDVCVDLKVPSCSHWSTSRTSCGNSSGAT